MIIVIDPGSNTGIAYFNGGRLEALRTVAPHEIHDAIIRARRVIFEDSRLISHVYTTTKSRAAALKMARNVGEIDAWCKLICAHCEQLGIPAHGISPKGKGAKVDAANFNQITGWSAKSNQHERDAAMVAWSYRSAK